MAAVSPGASPTSASVSAAVTLMRCVDPTSASNITISSSRLRNSGLNAARTTLITLTALPLSVLSTFIVFKLLGQSG